MKKLSFAVLAVLVLAGCSKQVSQSDSTNAAKNEGTNKNEEASMSAKPTNSPNANSTKGQMMKEADYKFKLEGLETPKREGWVTLTAMGAKTKVSIEMMEAAEVAKKASPVASASAAMSASVPMPAHIHMGTCPKPGDVKYPLTSIVDGKSVTEVAATIDEMMALGPISVNVHKSAAELTKYVACGNLDFKTAKMDKEGTSSGQMKSAKPSNTAKPSASPRATVAASAQ